MTFTPHKAHLLVTFTALLSACQGDNDKTPAPLDSGAGDSTPDSAPDPDSADSADSADSDPATGDCESLPDLPVTATEYGGFTSAEDFAFTTAGTVIAVDAYGNLVETAMDGTQSLLRPSIGSTAGTRILPDGDVVVCNVGEGSIQRIDLESGSVTTLASGFPYPNGMDIGLDGMIYFADTTRGNLYQVDPDSGAVVTVATGLYSPNGVAVSPDGETLYVGSFGGGAVYAVTKKEGGFKRARVFGLSTDAPGVPVDACPELEVGAECMLTSGFGVGTCTDDDGELYCATTLDNAACSGLSAGDSCTTTLLGESLESICVEADDGSGLFCPRSEAARVEECDGVRPYSACATDVGRGSCYENWEGVGVCVADTEYYTWMEEGCEDLALGDDCVAMWPYGPSAGECIDGSVYGMDGLACMPGMYASSTGAGGLDGIGVDTCGQVYVAEYTTGRVMRIASEGAEAELVVRLKSYWIPNIHWGPGAGGFESNVMYVADREHSSIHGVEVGVEGRPELYP